MVAPEKRAEGLQKAMEGLVGQLDKGHLRPLQKGAYLCMAACCDSATGPAELQQCTAACERKVQVANQLISGSIRDFQERLQRCVQRCQDKAQELLPTQPKDKDIARAQDSLASCAADCAQEYEKQTPRLQAEIVERLKQLK